MAILVESGDQNYIDGYLQEWGIRPGQPVICIHPGTGTAVKHWEEMRWARTADALTEQLDAPVVLTGGDHELPLTRRIAEQMRAPAVVMAGDTRVGQLAALFKRARVVLGPDSGPPFPFAFILHQHIQGAAQHSLGLLLVAPRFGER